MRSLVLVVLATSGLCWTQSTYADIQWAEVGVDGLTCSICTRSVEMGLRRLEFVEQVVMDLETTEGKIYFKPNSSIDPNEVAKAIVDAGFSVRFIRYNIVLDDIEVNDLGQFHLRGKPYQFLDLSTPLMGEVTVKLVDENFLPKKEATRWKKSIVEMKSWRDFFHVVKEN